MERKTLAQLAVRFGQSKTVEAALKKQGKEHGQAIYIAKTFDMIRQLGFYTEVLSAGASATAYPIVPGGGEPEKGAKVLLDFAKGRLDELRPNIEALPLPPLIYFRRPVRK